MIIIFMGFLISIIALIILLLVKDQKKYQLTNNISPLPDSNRIGKVAEVAYYRMLGRKYFKRRARDRRAYKARKRKNAR